MTTLADLKTRIATEMVRSDLEAGGDLAAQLLIHIQRACEFYSHERFWFNQIVTTAPTVAGTQTVDLPAAMRIIDKITIPASYTTLCKATLPELDPGMTAQSGIPTKYTAYTSSGTDYIRLYPVPDAVYTLQITGVQYVAPPSADADDTIWTNEAQDLIVARTRMTLYRDQFRDPDGTQLAIASVQEALQALRRETGKRGETPLMPRDYSHERFNINYG
jgi:hypothetical protein